MALRRDLGSTARFDGTTGTKRQTMNQVQLSHHVLPNASTMLRVCLTGIGLVNAEAHLVAYEFV
jgi:hypothetical protein